MANAIVENGHLPDIAPETASTTQPNGMPETPVTTPQTKKRQNNRKKANYNLIHKYPLPLTTHPLPAFHPTNPISLLQLAYTYVAQLLRPPSSHPSEPYIGYWSPETRSIHVTDPQHIRALWEMGFFGKGTLSRSEPSWLDREKARLKSKRAGGGTAEEVTNARREKRRAFKLERARAEAEKIEKQRLVEEGKLDPSVLETAVEESEQDVGSNSNDQPVVATFIPRDAGNSDVEDEEDIDVENQEFLQLTMEEAFFLTYGLGVLSVRAATDMPEGSFSTSKMVDLFARHSYFPPKPQSRDFAVDDPFMLSYVTYHHFRSLGWVVRPGVKFSVDYMLYLRGPVFSHAEFAVIIMPAYTDPYWETSDGKAKRRIKEDEQKDWWWLHCINRVQSQVLKSLVLVYVDIPPPSRESSEIDIGKLLKGYKIREFVVKRWLANRMRD